LNPSGKFLISLFHTDFITDEISYNFDGLIDHTLNHISLLIVGNNISTMDITSGGSEISIDRIHDFTDTGVWNYNFAIFGIYASGEFCDFFRDHVDGLFGKIFAETSIVFTPADVSEVIVIACFTATYTISVIHFIIVHIYYLKWKTFFTKMEPSYSVLIFSKYSPNCKKLFDLVSTSGIDLERMVGNKLQLLCIDNEQVRKRIKSNNQIDVTTVPCILSIFPNGGVEKYDGVHAFAWIENLINKFAPPPPPPVQFRPTPVREEYIEQPPVEEEANDVEPEPQPVQKPRPSQQKRSVKVPARMKPIHREDEQEEEDETVQATSIGDIPLEESGTDRHRNLPQPRRIRKDEDQYIEDENLFSGEAPDIRRGPTTGLRPSSADRKNSPDPNGVRAKAEELARGRDNMDMDFGAPSRRPISDRRP
jgi:hypothetical protein